MSEPTLVRVLAPRDPWAGDEVLDDPVGSEYRGQPIAPDDEWDRRFRAAYRAVLDGRAPLSAVEEPARRLGIAGPVRHDRRPATSAPRAVADGVLADIVEDLVPDIGMIAPDRVLGPWADLAVPRPIRVVAAAVMAFAPLLEPAVTAVARHTKAKPRPSVVERRAIAAIRMAPPCLWRVERLRPLLRVAPGFVPEGPVDFAGAPFAIARAVPVPEGVHLACALPLPHAPPPEVLERRLRLEYLRQRRHERRLTWEDLLRTRGEVLYRTACEWSYLHDAHALWDCWSRWSPDAAASPR